MEIEKKFLIRTPMGFSLAGVDLINVWKIQQQYLLYKDGYERRIRSIKEGRKKTRFSYTEKKSVSYGTREENEREITEDEYNTLQKEAIKDKSLYKRRYRFIYNDMLYELDLYDLSNKYAILEVELSDIKQEVAIPPMFELVKEVTNDRRYSNAYLAEYQKLEEV